MKKLVVIDGKSVFYRGYYAMPNLSTKDGVPTGGVYGFATMALEIIKKLGPDYVCVAWDKPKTNIRRRLEIYSKYKAGRKPPPADFYPQIPLLHELLEAFGWPLYELDDYEADDIMGTLAVQAREQNIETILVTSDLDMLQLVNGHVKVYALKKGLSNIEEYHPESFTEKYGITPDQFIDLKALKGDSSDNIPGVPGIGEKGGVALLQQFKTLDGIYDNIELVTGSTKTKLIAGKDLAYMSHKLAEIWLDAPLKLDLTEVDGSKCNPNKVMQVLQNLEFKSLVRQLPEIMKVDESALEQPVQNFDISAGRMTVVNSEEDLNAINTSKWQELVLASYATGKHGQGGKYLLIAPDKKDVYVINLEKISAKNICDKLKTVLADKKVKKFGYDIKSTIKVLFNLGMDISQVDHDVLIGAFLINSVRREQSLTDLARSDLGYDGPDLDNLSPEEYLERAAQISSIIRALYDLQAEQK